MTAALTAPTKQTTSMPILSAVPFDHPALVRSIRDWNDAEQVHKAVMSLFRDDLPGPQHQRRATAQILYRVEYNAARILLQSAAAPARSDYGIRTTDLSGLATHLATGTAVRFRLDINAVRCQAGTHRRTPVPDAELPGWVAARVHPALTAVTLLDQPVTVRRTGNSPLRVAHLTGTARVNDPDVLISMIRSGVGRAKSYGCGLLSVLPIVK